MEDLVLYRVDGKVATIVLNRPEARNALSDELREQLRARLAAVSADPAVRVIILTGSGRAFCAGGDVQAMKERLEAPAGQVAINGWTRQQQVYRLVSDIHRTSQVTIAAVNGAAVGLGFDLALACDFIVAAPDAFFAASFVSRGLVSDGGGMYFLPRRVGLSRAKDLLFSGRRVSVKEARELGIVDEVADNELLDAAAALAARYAGQPQVPVTLMKSILNRSLELTLDGVAALGSQAQAVCYTTDEHRRSVQDFLAR
jgi:2-(1,2-epoxy-1,2-dihydrophenyl)acetyl-CoA isomerase